MGYLSAASSTARAGAEIDPALRLNYAPGAIARVSIAL
jgi:hypothetical protein